MGWLSKVWGAITNTEQVQVRARNKKGHYVADDKSTPDVNEAWKSGKSPKKTKKVKKNNKPSKAQKRQTRKTL